MSDVTEAARKIVALAKTTVEQRTIIEEQRIKLEKIHTLASLEFVTGAFNLKYKLDTIKELSA